MWAMWGLEHLETWTNRMFFGRLAKLARHINVCVCVDRVWTARMEMMSARRTERTEKTTYSLLSATEGVYYNMKKGNAHVRVVLVVGVIVFTTPFRMFFWSDELVVSVSLCSWACVCVCTRELDQPDYMPQICMSRIAMHAWHKRPNRAKTFDGGAHRLLSYLIK